ncbi:hypothetical protein LA080_002768 [Diaporthe eres]|nr:hypothetical protein LA080_002768 [Diaporthe eres]
MDKLKSAAVQTSFNRLLTIRVAFTICHESIELCQRPMAAEIEAQPVGYLVYLSLRLSASWAVSKHADGCTMQRVGSAGGARGRAGWAGSGCNLKAVPSGQSTGFSLLDPEECLTRQSAFSIPSSAKRSRTGDIHLGRYRQAAAAQWKPKPRVNAGAGQLQLIERLVLSFIRALLQQSTPCDLENHDGFGAFHPIFSAVLQNRPSPSCTARPFLGAPAATGMPSEVSARILRARNKASITTWVLAAEGGREMLEAKHSDIAKQHSE